MTVRKPNFKVGSVWANVRQTLLLIAVRAFVCPLL